MADAKSEKGPSSLKRKMLSDLADQIRKEFPARKESVPEVKSSVVMGVARQMAKAGYEFTDESLGFLVDYLKGYNIWMLGSPGVGKSFFFECLNRVRRMSGMSPILVLNMSMVQMWSKDEINEWMKTAENYDIVIDDPTEKSATIKVYGDEVLLIQYLLECRIGVKNHRTHIITNFDIASVRKFYNERSADRFVMLFRREKFSSGSSRRRLKVWVSPETEGGGVI